MSIFVVLTTTQKEGVINPDIIGPFPDLEAAEAFASSGEVEAIQMVTMDMHGGYHGEVIVCAENAETPEEWLEGYADLIEEMVHNGTLVEVEG